MKQVRVVVSGLVQGIGFRYFVLEQAQKLNITGWVRNTQDLKVEALFQGQEQKVQDLIELCRKGPGMAQVENIQEFPAYEPKYEDFVIKTN